MNEFMKVLLSLSVSGTLLLLPILGLKPLYKTKFSKRWQYYIWIIVALRFLLPFTPDTTIVGSYPYYPSNFRYQAARPACKMADRHIWRMKSIVRRLAFVHLSSFNLSRHKPVYTVS